MSSSVEQFHSCDGPKDSNSISVQHTHSKFERGGHESSPPLCLLFPCIVCATTRDHVDHYGRPFVLLRPPAPPPATISTQLVIFLLQQQLAPPGGPHERHGRCCQLQLESPGSSPVSTFSFPTSTNTFSKGATTTATQSGTEGKHFLQQL